MSGLGDNLGKYLHPARNVKPDEAEVPAAVESPAIGERLRPRLNVQRLKPKTPEQAKESADDAEVLRTRASLIGTRG